MKERYSVQWEINGQWATIGDSGLTWAEANEKWDDVQHHTGESVRLRVIRERDGFVMMGEGTPTGAAYTHLSPR